ncbi:MAG: hypothetical protein AAFX78_07385 [Cyanobacteria bacterium J06638_20]
MSQPHPSTDDRHPLEQYEIRIKGHLDQRWSHWFGGFALAQRHSDRSIALKDNGETLLSGSVVDQAALYGVLIKVRDLGLPLISVMPTQLKQAKSLDKGEQA